MIEQCFIDYHDNGNIRSKTHLLNSRFHNPNGPAYFKYYENGNKSVEEFYIHGKFHNINGAAQIWYNEDETISIKYYYLNGILLFDIYSDEELKRYIKLNNIT